MDTQIKNMNCQSEEVASSKYGFDCLPQEVVIDIASRLPVTSLLQFTFVRKSFYNLSHDPELLNLHMSRAVMNDPSIIINSGEQLYFLEYGVEDVLRKISIPFAYSISRFKVFGSCEGLLCISDTLFSDALYVYNPLTVDYIRLPKSEVDEMIFGFGFHPITKEYKVIKIVNYLNLYYDDPSLYPSRMSDVEVFTLGSSSWRSIGKVVYQIDPCCQGIALNGKMHWLTLIENDSRIIVSFDFADEVFDVVPNVDFGHNPTIVQFQLAILGGCLAVSLTLSHQNGGGNERIQCERILGEGVCNRGLYTKSHSSFSANGESSVSVEEWKALA